MISPLRLLFAGLLFAAAGPALAQQAKTPPANAPRPAFCILNALDGLPVTAEVTAGKAATKIQIPAGRHACCVKFCAENPAPAGYRIALQAQPAGAAKPQPLCTASLKTGRALRVSGDPAKALCEEAKL